MYLAADHPRFDIALECLCSLPPAPGCVRETNLIRDLKLRNREHLHAQLAELRKRGFAIRQNNLATSGRVIFIARDGWDQARREADRYFADVCDAPTSPTPSLCAA